MANVTVAATGPFRVRLDTGDAQFPVLSVRCIERGANMDTELLLFDGVSCRWVPIAKVNAVEIARAR